MLAHHTRKLIIGWLAFVSIGLTCVTHADVVFPLHTGRPQVDGNCWAYGAAHLLEARAQYRSKISAVTHIEKSFLYWNVYQRLLNSGLMKKKAEMLTDVGGYSAEFFDIFANYGFEFLDVRGTSKPSTFPFPQSQSYPVAHPSSPNRLVNERLIEKTERELIQKKLPLEEMKNLIRTRLKAAFNLSDPLNETTRWLNGTIMVSDSYAKLLGTDFKRVHQTNPALLISNGSYFGSDVSDQEWVKYDADRHWAYVIKDMKKILALMRIAMDRGWPTTIETPDHVMTALGYRTMGNSYSYAISDSSGAYFGEGIHWISEEKLLNVATDITVLHHVIQDLIPEMEHEASVRSVHIPRKH